VSGTGEQVVVLAPDGRELGEMEKLAAHQGRGTLHRAFSVFLFHPDGRMLVHRRASSKHHFRDLWTNACCSHPRPGETVTAAAARRVAEELGLELAESAFTESGSFVYRALDPTSGLVEHEWDHVVVATTDRDPVPDPDEVGEWRWARVDELRSEVASHPERFTPWFPLAWSVLDDPD
jgi:isopentenyl-diphosphate delta-isomerase